MSADTDFYDDDLVRRPDSSRSPDPNDPERAAVRQEADALLGKLQHHRDTVEEQVARTRSDLERLRQKQEDLEKERLSLEDIRRRQDDYEQSKRTLIEKLQKSLVQLEKEEVRTNQVNELYGTTRKRFLELLGDIESIDESTWPTGETREQLYQAQLLVDQVRVESSKSLARIDSVVGALPEDAADEAESPESRGFGYWLMVGCAIGLPLSLLLGVVAIAAAWVIGLMGG